MPRPRGRPKGSKNFKPTISGQMQSIREAFTQAFHEIGGAKALADWAREERTEYYKLAARLIPLELVGNKDQPIQIITRAE